MIRPPVALDCLPERYRQMFTTTNRAQRPAPKPKPELVSLAQARAVLNRYGLAVVDPNELARLQKQARPHDQVQADLDALFGRTTT